MTPGVLVHRLALLTGLLLFALDGACGGGSEPVIAAECASGYCTCSAPSGHLCHFEGAACSPGICHVSCGDNSSCEGSCTNRICAVECRPGSTCTVTLGRDGTLTCLVGATCNVTCTDRCTITSIGAKGGTRVCPHGSPDVVTTNGTASCGAL